MKKLVFLFLLFQSLCIAHAQTSKSKIVVEHIKGASLENSGGEDPNRRVTIYLPPGYDKTTGRYPVIYFLHGFSWTDSLFIATDHFDKVLDKAISSGKIKPVIVVFPNEYTLYKGSFYTNSTVNGRWADFTAKDLVTFIDSHYRTIANRDSRGISGHSMGGHGAIKIAMLYPDVFSTAYALSPAVLDFQNELGPGGESYKHVPLIKSRQELLQGKEFLATLVVAMARAYSPNPAKPPFYVDLPYSYQNDSTNVDQKVLELWQQNTPMYMVEKYADNLRKLKALKLDWGRNDEFSHIPMSSLAFSKKLEKLGINHYAEEYIGTHGSKILSDDGRVLNEVMPFFDTYLNFGHSK